MQEKEQGKIKDKYFQEFAERITMGIHIWKVIDPSDITKCELVFVNEKANKVVEIDLSKSKGMTLGELFPSFLKGAIFLAFSKVMETHTNERVISFSFQEATTIKGNRFRAELVPLSNNMLGILFTNITYQRDVEIKLQKKIKEIESFNKLMVGRELKMVKLKKELESLKNVN